MNQYNERGLILVVDDEKEITMTLKGFFSAIGYEMLATLDGSEAVKILDTVKNIDLILLDLRMPGVNGIDILKKVRAEMPKTKVIVITAYSKDTKEELEKIGIDGLIPKPIDLSQLIDRIKYVLKDRNEDTRVYPTKESIKEKAEASIPKAKLLFLEPNPIVFGFTCAFFATKELIDGEYEMKVAYGDREGLNHLYDYYPDIVIMYDALYNMEDTKELAALMMSSSHKPKTVILHGMFPKMEVELIELKKLGIQYCNQNSMDDDGLRVSNKKLSDFVASECRRFGLVKKN